MIQNAISIQIFMFCVIYDYFFSASEQPQLAQELKLMAEALHKSGSESG